ncbi:MAG: glycogen/starch synthase, partial [Candidatus Scatosoma sp.]
MSEKQSAKKAKIVTKISRKTKAPNVPDEETKMLNDSVKIAECDDSEFLAELSSAAVNKNAANAAQKNDTEENDAVSAGEGVTIVPKRKILFVVSECTPFIATGGLAEVAGSLSKTLAQDEKYDVRVVMPLYSDIRGDYRRKFKYLGNIYVPLSWRNQYCGIFSYEEDG